VDFGTSGTKLAFRDYAEKGRRPYVVDFGTALPGFSRFAYPSTVAFGNDRVVTGARAYDSDYGTLIRAPKVHLLRECREASTPLPRFPGDAAGVPLDPASVPAAWAGSAVVADVLRAGAARMAKG